MNYNPDKHHRRSIRLKGYDYTSSGAYFITICTHRRKCLFGEILDGEMQLNPLGQIVRSHWMKLPRHHSHLQLDAFVVMPNHLHGILVLTERSGGTNHLSAKPVRLTPEPVPANLFPSPKRCSLSEIIRGFKTFSARHINQVRKSSGVPVWQRNYYEHIIRNDQAWQTIQVYIQNNPLSWQRDRLHPNERSHPPHRP